MTGECERYRVLIHGHLDGELTPDEERELSEHVAACERCAAAFEGMRALTQDLDRMSLDFGEVHLWDKVRVEVLPSRRKKLRGYVFPGALVATMVIYKVIDAAAGFGVAILLKPAVLLVVGLLLALHRQNPFRLSESLDGNSSGRAR